MDSWYFSIWNADHYAACHYLDLQGIDGLYCVGDSCFPGQGVIAVSFSGIMCAHRVAADIGKHYLSVMTEFASCLTWPVGENSCNFLLW